MTTFVYALAEGIPDRLSELRLSIKHAEHFSEKDEGLYSILCRAGCVLAVSSLEAFLKDVSDAIQSDLNANVDAFSKMPKSMQREFARKVVHFDNVPEDDIQKRVTHLLKFLSVNTVTIDMAAFPYKENQNRNPSANVIDHSFKRYGINSVLHCLSGSRFEVVFGNDSAADLLLRREIKRMRANLYHFPYKPLPSKFTVADWTPVKGKDVPQSMWHTYLENLLRRRHGVVHAETRDNPTSWEALRADAEKLEVLMSGVTFAVASLVGRDLGTAN